ncbi:OmpA family protein [Flavobacterium cerinum]|uniref:Flagellar motor protein MotB n=1 Tax=Flavobacterium cerinum TaxID=2502784 RepID=A0A3S3SAE3_9FLAO|nr:OmpA family protein [Flavobacterium cerinum]RWW96750.1 flagellar motor protein MotB [Flavobacterium cerinum]
MKHKYLFIALLSITSFVLNAQQAKIKRADKDYDNFAYIDAIKTYERVAEKGYKDVEMFKKLGNAYYFNAEFDKAEKWYAELFAMVLEVEPEYYYRYSQSLKAIGKYDQANTMLDAFNEKSGNDLRARLYNQQKDYLKVIEENSGRFVIENAGINSGYQDYGTAFFKNQLVFASSRTSKGVSMKIHKWNNQPFTSMFASNVDGGGNLQEPERFQPNIDTKFDEATPVFTNDGTTLYFTRSNYTDGKKRKSDDRVTKLKLYKATLNENGNFTNVKELPFNSDQYSTAHPALSPDEKTLYFASDMPGTYGQSDLYKVSINEDGSFGTPENLGTGINTEGKETFPFISNDHELYFSSDGHPGLGGLDVFVSKIGDSFKEVINIGAPINCPMDDFAFLIDTKTQVGFFSSNREGGLGYDDIYKFKELKKLSCEQLLTGIVTDVKTGAILTDTKVTLFDEKMNKITEVYSDAKGTYTFDVVECKKVYYVRANKKDYNPVEQTVVIGSETGETKLPFEMEPYVIPVKVGDDLAKVFKIKIIYFDLDKWNIRPDAAFDLAKIVDVMKEHPTMKIDVRSHTDSQQSHRYNEKLSDRRAKSTIAWMIGQGIEANRLTGRGYGETQLINKCSDNVECTEDEHQANRRSEFIIMSL